MINSILHRSITRVSHFYRKEDGVAAIEFAFIAPLLVVFLLGTTTATQSLWANGKVSQTASVLGDLISQETTEVDDASFESLMNAAPVLMEPFPVGDLKVVITAAIVCHQDPSDTTGSVPEMFVVWNRGWENGALVDGGAMPGDDLKNAPTNLSIADSDYLMKTVVTYTYEPTISQRAGHSIDMEEIAYHQPRDDRPVSYPDQEGNDDTKNCDKLLNR